MSVKSKFFSSILDFFTKLYRWPPVEFIWKLFPYSTKRRVRNFLIRNGNVAAIGDQIGVRSCFSVVRTLGHAPVVTIVIPVFNHAPYIEKCIKSALDQTWKHLEVIVVNDASTDPEVYKILETFATSSRFEIIHNLENTGICQAQNRAIIRSTGDIIAFLDCDDFLAPEAIEKCMNSWRDDTIYMHTGRINVDQNGEKIGEIHFESLPRKDYFTENLRGMYATHLKMIRRDAFARVGMFDPRFDSAQDYEMLMRIAFYYPSSSFVHVSDFLYFHRMHSQQTTERQRDRQKKMTEVIQYEAHLRSEIRRGNYRRLISIVMLSYGKHSQTLNAITAIENTIFIPHEIILYDNGSSDETVNFLRDNIEGQYKNVKVFYGEKNLGPAQGRRVAFEKASGEWFIVFDNDEIPEPGWLEELLLRAESNENVGAVCCRVVFPDKKLQFSGGRVDFLNSDDVMIDLALHDRGKSFDCLETCIFREVDWCPIGATLFTRNIAPYLHDGYPNTFEDAGVSFALKKEGLRLLNAPGALVWHEHITFQPKAEMREKYMRDRYNPQLMLKSVASFYKENNLLIRDEYIWRENGLQDLSRQMLVERLDEALLLKSDF